MLRFEDIREVHMEATSRCSLRCPHCPRTADDGETNAGLPLVQLSIGQVRAIFAPEFAARLSGLVICGNYGDPTAASDLLEIVGYFRSSSPGLRIQVNTHGSARPEAWWAALAGLGVVCHFSVDGLADTNHVYRRGSSWEVVMRSVRAFIGAGGDAVWDFLVFAHNEHQVDEARLLSEQLGFREFVPKKSARFIANSVVQESRSSVVREERRAIEVGMPVQEKYRNAGLQQIRAQLPTPESYDGYLQTTRIACKAVSGRGIYVSAEGYVFPCCYLGHIHTARPYAAAEQVRALTSSLPGGLQSLSALEHGIEAVVGGPFFQRSVPGGWAAGEGRLRMCAQQCGEFDTLRAQR